MDRTANTPDPIGLRDAGRLALRPGWLRSLIPARFNGPPETAHGGYACAVAAQFLGWSAEVSLRRPPPLERPLEVRS